MNVKPLELHITQDDRIAVIELDGPVNSAHSPKLRKAINQVFSDNILGLIIDFNKSEYIDSSGIATLVEAMQLANEKKAKVVFTGTIHDHSRADPTSN